MLVLMRKPGQKLLLYSTPAQLSALKVDENGMVEIAEISVVNVVCQDVRIGVEADRRIGVVRDEVYQRSLAAS